MSRSDPCDERGCRHHTIARILGLIVFNVILEGF